MTKAIFKFDFMFRLIVLILSVSLGVVFLLASAHAAFAATAKPVSVVDSPKLTVGDVFDGLSPEKAAHVLGSTPQPGQEMVLNANILTRIAVAMDLPWRPASNTERVVIRRAATIIESDKIKAALEDRLKDEGINGNFRVEYNSVLPKMVLPSSQSARFEISDMRFDPQKDYFEATLVAPSVEHPLSQTTVSGHVDRLVKIPVLRNTMQAGDIIGTPDVDWIEISASELQRDYITDPEDLNGMTPRRVIMAGKPMRTLDLQAPILVGRGDTVALLLRSGSMELSAQGRALQNGAKGDIVRVVNNNSNRSIEGIVTGDHEVTVQN